MKRSLILFLMAAIAFDACAPKPVVTRKDNTVDTYFGTEVPDPYRWLEDDSSEETAAWVKAQNKVTDYYLKRLPGREKLLKRLTEVANYEKVGIPFHEKNGKWYIYKNNGLQNQSVLYEMESPEDVPVVFMSRWFSWTPTPFQKTARLP